MINRSHIAGHGVLGLIVGGLVYSGVLWCAAQNATEPVDCSRLEAELERARGQIEIERLRVRQWQTRHAALEKRLREALLWRVVRELEAEVAELRGLPIRRPIEVEMLDREGTERLIRRLIERDWPDSVAIARGRVLDLLGAMEPGADLREIIIGLYSEQTGGLYDDTTGKLYLTDLFDPESRVARVVIAHEICHALQDQNFDFSRYSLHRHDNDDQVFAVLSALEGDATLLMMEYMQRNLSATWLLELPKLMSLDQRRLNEAPPYLQYLLIFPYIQGMQMVMESLLVGPEGRNRLLADPPRSTAQVLHPERYFSGTADSATTVSLFDISDHLTGGWEPLWENSMGEAGLRALLIPRDKPMKFNMMSMRPLTLDPLIERAARGWAADRIGLWISTATGPPSPQSPAILQWRIDWESEADAVCFRDYAATHWLPRILPEAQSDPLPAAQWAWLKAWRDPARHTWVLLHQSRNSITLFIGQGDTTSPIHDHLGAFLGRLGE